MEKALKYWPIVVAAFAIISAGVTAQYQIKSHSDSIQELKAFVTAINPKLLQITSNKDELTDLSESIDENEEWLGELQYQINNLN